MAMKLLQKARVVSVQDETPRVRKITLKHALRETLRPFDAGSHVTVALPEGINRQYSLCGDPQDSSRYSLGILLEDHSRGGSRSMHALCPGDVVFVSYPANSFSLCSNAKHHVLLAGGIGVTPILSMAHTLSADGMSFEVHYGARSQADLGFLGTLQALCPPDRLHVYAEDLPNAKRPDLLALLQSLDSASHVYACGPAPMLAALDVVSKNLGFPTERIHKEQFAALKLTAGERQGEPFEIEITDTGEILSVAADQSALEALRHTGYTVPSSCEGGICGECRLDLVKGTAIHRDRVLSEEAKQTSFISCVSRGKGCIAIQLPPQSKVILTKINDVQ